MEAVYCEVCGICTGAVIQETYITFEILKFQEPVSEISEKQYIFSGGVCESGL